MEQCSPFILSLTPVCSLYNHSFLSFTQILQVGSEDAQMHALFADSFAALGRLDNITLVMVFHPQYLESFLKTQHYLLQMDGPLPLHYRHYIGIMVCKHIMKNYFCLFFLISLRVNAFDTWINTYILICNHILTR